MGKYVQYLELCKEKYGSRVDCSGEMAGNKRHTFPFSTLYCLHLKLMFKGERGLLGGCYIQLFAMSSSAHREDGQDSLKAIAMTFSRTAV